MLRAKKSLQRRVQNDIIVKSGPTRIRQNRVWSEISELQRTYPNNFRLRTLMLGTMLFGRESNERDKALKLYIEGIDGSERAVNRNGLANHVSYLSAEEAILAKMVSDQQELETRLDLLLPIWSKLGHYEFVRSTAWIFPQRYYSYLLEANLRDKQWLDFDRALDYATAAERLTWSSYKNIYLGESTLSPADQQRLMSEYGSWTPENKSVRLFDHFAVLKNSARADVVRNVFVLDKDKSITLQSHELENIRFKVAALRETNRYEYTNAFQLIFNIGGLSVARKFDSSPGENWQFNTQADNTNNLRAYSRKAQTLDKLIETKESSMSLVNIGQFDTVQLTDKTGVLNKLRTDDISELTISSNVPADRTKPAVNNRNVMTKDEAATDSVLASSFDQTNLREIEAWYRPVAIDQLNKNTLKKPLSPKLGEMSNTDINLCLLSETAALNCVEERLAKLSGKDLGVAADLMMLANEYPTNTKIYKARYSVFEHFIWRRIKDIPVSASDARLEHEGFLAFSKAVKLKYYLSAGHLKTPYLLSGRRVQGFDLALESANEIEFKLLALKPDFSRAKRVRLNYQVNDKTPREISFSQGAVHRIKLKLDIGNQNIRFWLNEASRDESLQIAISAEGAGELNRQTFRYAVANSRSKVEFKVKGPRWIKVLSLTDAKFEINEQYVPKGWNTLRFEAKSPNTGKGETFYRFFTLQEAYAEPEYRSVAIEAIPVQADALIRSTEIVT